jgi:hypothetical protein
MFIPFFVVRPSGQLRKRVFVFRMNNVLYLHDGWNLKHEITARYKKSRRISSPNVAFGGAGSHSTDLSAVRPQRGCVSPGMLCVRVWGS